MEEKEFNYINVIPLVDVMLVLLTIVLTTSTFIASGMISVSLPKALHSQETIAKQTTVVSIDRRGAVHFNSKIVGMDELGRMVRALDRETPILVRADQDIRLQAFVDVLDLLNGEGMKRVAIQTEKQGG